MTDDPTTDGTPPDADTTIDPEDMPPATDDVKVPGDEMPDAD